MSDNTSLANMPYADPPSDDQYQRAARTLARLSAGDIDGLRTALEAIGFIKPPPRERPRKRPNGSTGPLARCQRDLHDMVGKNVVIDSSGRRCRECRNESQRIREGGGK